MLCIPVRTCTCLVLRVRSPKPPVPIFILPGYVSSNRLLTVLSSSVKSKVIMPISCWGQDGQMRSLIESTLEIMKHSAYPRTPCILHSWANHTAGSGPSSLFSCGWTLVWYGPCSTLRSTLSKSPPSSTTQNHHITIRWWPRLKALLCFSEILFPPPPVMSFSLTTNFSFHQIAPFNPPLQFFS